MFTRVGGDHWEADFLVDPREGAFTVALRLDGAQSVLGSRPPPDSSATLRIRSTEPTWNGPDDIELGIGHGTGTDVLGRLDGRYLATEVAGGFTGRLIGLWTESGQVLVRRVRFTEQRA
ncbi:MULTISPECIES: hypothetical protein [Streptomyces]|uniref:hypothetical protein n=1 Tax=Streptomyces TaxID=1883 RepID=UPI0014882BBA|nr:MULTISPECIES: hypothetical protein [Streptomyces]